MRTSDVSAFLWIVLVAAIAVAPFGCSSGSSSSPPPGYALSLDKNAATGFAGSFALVNVTVTSAGGFVDPVTLSVVNLPTGVTAVFNPATVQGQGASALTLTVTGAATVGTYALMVRGTSGTMTQDAPLSFEVIAVPTARFTLSTSPASLALIAGTAGQSMLTLNPTGGFSADVTLSVTGAPVGMNVIVNPMTINTTTPTATIDVTPMNTLAAGTYTLTITGVSGILTELATVMVAVANAPVNAGLNLFTPTYAATTPGNVTATRLGVERANGVTGSVTFAIQNAPTGITAVFNPNPCPANGCKMSLLADTSVAPGYYPVEVEGTSGASSGKISTILRVGNPTETVDTWVSRLDIAQTVFGNDVRLVPDKDAILRAHVLADRTLITSPTVRLTATQGSSTLGTLALTGPTTLPTAEDDALLSQSFNATIPAAWVQSGVNLSVTVDPDATLTERDETNNTKAITPTVASDTTLDLVVVPLILDGRTGTDPGLQTPVYERWPLKTLNITVRAAYTVTTVAKVQSGGAGWTEVLAEVAALRAMDNSNANYYGVIKVDYSFGVAGIGYIGFPVSIGRDDSISTAVHELGHNLGLRHAPCGGASGADPNYPYPGGGTGAFGYRASTLSLLPPQTYVDTMGYCSPEWVSDYNYKIVHTSMAPNFAPNRSPVSGTPQAGTLIQGKIVDGAFTLMPPYPTVRAPKVEPSGTHWLTVRGAGGAARSVPFTPRAIGCGPDQDRVQHFSVFVPDVGTLTAIEIDRGGRRVFTATDVPAAHAAAIPATNAIERDNVVKFSWDDSRYDTATIVHLGERRTTVALWRRGGKAEIDTRQLPVGGSWEVTLAKGLQTARVMLAR